MANIWGPARRVSRGALASFEASLAIATRLASSDPGNAGWQADWAASHGKMGQFHLANGDAEKALGLFQDGARVLRRGSGHVLRQGYAQSFDADIALVKAALDSLLISRITD